MSKKFLWGVVCLLALGCDDSAPVTPPMYEDASQTDDVAECQSMLDGQELFTICEPYVNALNTCLVVYRPPLDCRWDTPQECMAECREFAKECRQ